MKYPHTYILIPFTPDRRKLLTEAMVNIQENTDPEVTPYSFVLYENNYIGYPNAILDMIKGIEGFVFMGATDLYPGKDWLEILWKKMDEHQGFRNVAVEPFNEFWGGKMVQHFLAYSDVVKRYFHRYYFHYYCDNEMTERIALDGTYVYCPDAPMEHRHVLNGKAEKDKCYEVAMDPERNAKDFETYKRRKAANWPL